MFNMKPVGAQRLAVMLAYAYSRIDEAVRPIDKRIATAEFKGQTKAANAVGYGHTENHVHMMVNEFYRANPKPAFNATDGTARIAWEDLAAEKLGRELEASK